jgi:NDP-sugar pyrophosphorylase family protein
LTVAILAGGLATRLRPVTETIPKALVEVAGEPFLGRQLRLLRERGVERVVLCVGYRGEQVREYAGSGERFGLAVDYAFDGPTLLGTAGAIRRALALLPERFLVLYGDSYLPCDYGAVMRAFETSGADGLMTVYRNQGQWDSSNVEYAGGRILAYDKANRTERMRHIDYGLGAFGRDVFAALPDNRPSDLAALYQDLLRRGRLAAFEAPERFYEIGSFAGIRDLEEYLAR